MQYRKLGKTDLMVSEIGHGLWGMGGWSGSDEASSLEALRLSVKGGCNFFDTAWAYGSGLSDKLLGKIIAEFPDKEIIVAGKVPPKNFVWPGTSENTITETFPKKHVFEYVQKSLENLQVDSIDILQFHVWDDSWTENDEWKITVQDLKAQGLIKYFGLSLNRWEPTNGIEALKTGVVDTVQVIYNIFDQAPEDVLFPICQELNIGVIARVPLDEGGLTGKLTKDTRFSDDDWRATYFGSENLAPTVDRANKLQELVPDGMTLPEMALRFTLSSPVIGTTIVGMRKEDHILANLAVSDGKGLSGKLLSDIKEHRWDREVTPWAN